MKIVSHIHRCSRRAFSLIELMVAMGILSILMLMLTVLLDQVQESWRYSESRLSQFREARVAFDIVTKNLGQASLNTYWDLEDEDGDGLVDRYFRTSELHFLNMEARDLGGTATQEPVGHAVFFQAPLGFSSEYRNLNNLFNGRGYFVAFGSDVNFRPSFVRSAEKFRYRLFEFRPPAEANQIFEDGAQERLQGESQIFSEWFRQGIDGIGSGDFEDHLNPLAENIVTLIVSPRDSLSSSTGGGRSDTFSEIAPNYVYDSNENVTTGDNLQSPTAQQVPPLVRVTMVAIDETSAVRLEDGTTRPAIVDNNLFRNTANYEQDLETLVEYLNEEEINHKVFSSMVMLRSGKWSEF